uniref:Protein farnesyltransferase/geranylgeranyltransferase type-1 subunit alpha n=1 Tax=Ditylenchus dipsaci TaxID=166011 RepID=A0A915EJC3_9BILA
MSERALELTKTCAFLNAANYSVWQYRRNIILALEKMSRKNYVIVKKLLLTTQKIIKSGIIVNDGFKEETYLDKEVAFTLYAIKKIPNNESSWSYLAGILINDGLTAREDVTTFCDCLLGQDPPCKSVHLRNFVVDCIVELLEKKKNVEKNVKRAHEILSDLELLDPVRKKYWRYRRTYVDNLVAFA